MTSTMRKKAPIAFKVEIDWSRNGYGSGDDITGYVRSVITETGISTSTDRIAGVGSITVVVNNPSSRPFTPIMGSPWFGRLRPRTPIRVSRTREDGTMQILAIGWIKSISPGSGRYMDGARYATIEAYDLMGILSASGINIPVILDATADTLIKLILSATFQTAYATAAVTFAAQPANGDTVAINGKTYTFKTTLTVAHDIKIGATLAETITNFAAAINGMAGSGTLYGTSTTQPRLVVAGAGATTLTLEATVRGTYGNAFTLTAIGTNISVTAWTGGVDPSTDCETGRIVFPVAGDQWSEGTTTAAQAIDHAVTSEWGMFWVSRAGVPTFRNQNYAMRTGNAIARYKFVQSLSAARMDQDLIFNRVVVTYTPRGQLNSGIIGKVDDTITAPGQSGTERYNPTKPVVNPSGGDKTATLNFVDPATGQAIACRELVLPLVAGTDYTISENENGTGYDYTYWAGVTFSVAVKGTSAEVAIKNAALGPLYIQNLQLRGTGWTSYNPVSVILEDTTSQADYGRNELPVQLPLPVPDAFATALAYYLLNEYKNAALRLEEISFSAKIETSEMANAGRWIRTAGLFDVEIGDLIEITDHQAGLTRKRLLVTGVAYEWSAGGEGVGITFRVRNADSGDGQGGTANYGVWNYSTWDQARWGF